MRILIDLQPLQTPGVATRGIGRYTNGLLKALCCSHEVVGLRRTAPYLVPPSTEISALEIRSSISEIELAQVVSDRHFDVVLNCSGPNWEENRIVSGLTSPNRPLVASIFYDVIPWIFPDVYLQNPEFRQKYHNRCVDLYARADLVCAISRNSERDALRFGYATSETAATISLGVEGCVAEITNAHKKWNIPHLYLLNVSGDEYRKNPEMLIAAFLRSDIRRLYSLVIVISNDAETGFSNRMNAKYGDLETQGVILLREVTDSELGALYRDCVAFVFTSLYEGFGIPIIEAMQHGKWIISPKSSSLAESCGPALLSVIQDPSDRNSISLALDQAKQTLNQGPLDESVPRSHSRKFTWKQVVDNFEEAIERRRKVLYLKPPDETPKRPHLFWASPFPEDRSGIAFYSEDLIGPISRYHDVLLIPNTVSTFIPTPKTGRFKIVQPHRDALLAVTNGQPPRVAYNIGNSHFHLNLLELLFHLPGTVILHDSFVGGIETLWRQRKSSDAPALIVKIIESSRQIVFLAEDAKSLIAPEQLSKRPAYVVPHHCRSRGTISATRKTELRKKYGIPEDAFVVTTTGFQDRIKLTNRLVQGCTELRNFENAPVYVQVLGKFFNPEFEAEVRAMLMESKVEAFLSAEFVEEDVVIDRLALTDIAVFLRERSMGAASGALNDALGAGIPCLVTNAFAFLEYPEGAVLRVANNEVTEGLILLYRHPAIRQALAAGALQYAQEVSQELIAARLSEILSLWGKEQHFLTRDRTRTAERLLDSWDQSGRPTLGCLRFLLDVPIIGRASGKILKAFPVLRERIKRATFRETVIPLQVRQSSELSVVNDSEMGGSSHLEISQIVHKIRNRIAVELDRFVAEQDSGNPLWINLLRDGLDPESNVYAVDALRQLPDAYLFESLSILLFKQPLDKTRLVRLVPKLTSRRLAVLLICSVLPGRRARIRGLYTQAVRSILSKNAFLVSLAKRIYCHFT